MKTPLPKAPRITLNVTQEVIEQSMGRDSSHCMFAEAIKAAFPDARKPSVDLQTIRFTDPKKGLRYTYLTPRFAQVQIVRFDQGDETIEPFSLRLGGGHVTASGKRAAELRRSKTGGEVSEAKRAAGHRLAELNKTRLTVRDASPSKDGSYIIPDRVGGQTPPVQKVTGGIPFSRRREFGLRALVR